MFYVECFSPVACAGPVNNPGVGVFWLLLINFVLFGLDKFGAQMWVQVRAAADDSAGFFILF